jgi:hypothetical protein
MRCGEFRPTDHYVKRGSICKTCKKAAALHNKETGTSVCVKCGETKPRSDYMRWGKTCSACRVLENQAKDNMCARCKSHEDCKFLVSVYLPVKCEKPDEQDWFVYSSLPADVIIKAAGLVWFEKFKEVQKELL